MATTCIITGCALYDIVHSRWIHGDLFENSTGNYYIFNGVGQWNYEPCPDTKAITVANYWTRDKIFVMDSDDVTFNEAAVEYLKEK